MPGWAPDEPRDIHTKEIGGHCVVCAEGRFDVRPFARPQHTNPARCGSAAGHDASAPGRRDRARWKPDPPDSPPSLRGGVGAPAGRPPHALPRSWNNLGEMRLSLSVPDALWLRACEACPDTPPSRLVQAALEHLLADAETGYVPGPPAGAGERLRRL